MRRSRFGEEQIIGILREHEAGATSLLLRVCQLPLLRQGVLRFAFHRRELFSARPSHPKLEGPRVDSGMREAERCTDVTNAVVGEADGAAVLAELTPPLNGGRRKWSGQSGNRR